MMQDSNEIATCTIKIGFTEEELKRRDYRQYNTKINVESISIPNSVTEIKDGAFIGCSSLESIIIPNSVTSIGDWAFDRCVNLKTIYCKSSTPPVVGARLDIPEECIIYVPMGTSNAYKEAMWWRRHDIVEMSSKASAKTGENTDSKTIHFNNGTFALQSASGTLAYGTYMLKGNDIEFNIKQFLSSMEISKIKRFRIDSSSDEIGPLRKQSFINNTEMYANSDGLTWTESQYLALRDEICKLLETGVSTAKTESFTRTGDVRTERTETLE